MTESEKAAAKLLYSSQELRRRQATLVWMRRDRHINRFTRARAEVDVVKELDCVWYAQEQMRAFELMAVV